MPVTRRTVNKGLFLVLSVAVLGAGFPGVVLRQAWAADPNLTAPLTGAAVLPTLTGTATFKVVNGQPTFDLAAGLFPNSWVGKKLTVVIVRGRTRFLLTRATVFDFFGLNIAFSRLRAPNTVLRSGDVVQLLDGATLVASGTFGGSKKS